MPSDVVYAKVKPLAMHASAHHHKTLHDYAGSLVLGQDQECFAGCFSPLYALDGAMADLRIWSSARSQVRIETCSKSLMHIMHATNCSLDHVSLLMHAAWHMTLPHRLPIAVDLHQELNID